MSLQEWAETGGLHPHKTSAKEVATLLAIVERDLADAQSQISADWRFGIAYSAALKLCTILLSASGYRAEKDSEHDRTTVALPLILYYRKDDAEYLETCRAKWNAAEYDRAGVATEKDVAELVEYVKDLREDVLYWLQQCHPDLTPKKPK
ncbi:MAG TPA: hypothetical protein VKN18_23680 [Blastocatellia bacterium]|nr:hypothetical protein [Blastocatellia bacterium]